MLEDLPRLPVSTVPNAPEGWLLESFADDGARVLLVFDGIDEVPAGEKRRAILKQIETFAARFAKAQILLTTRPGAVDPASLNDFRRVALDELSAEQRVAFIEHWHNALGANFRRPSQDAVLSRLRLAVLRELERQPALGRLAANPLLCAAICALHWLQRRKVVEQAWRGRDGFQGFALEGAVLPGNLWNLSEKLVYMLAHQRDLDQELAGDQFGPEYRLPYELKREILARVAYAMVAGSVLSALPRDEAIGHIREALAGYRNRGEAPPEAILRALVERSGVLRAGGEDSVEFAHNTIKAFLAAKFYLGLRAPEELVRRLAVASPEEVASGLDEIAVFAAASPDHPAYAKTLVEALLSGQRWQGLLGQLWKNLPGRGPEVRRLQILALRCEAAGSQLPQETRALVARMAPALFPPRDIHEAAQLAAFGDAALEYLRPYIKPDATIGEPTIRCLRLIGTRAANELLETVLETSSLRLAEVLSLVFNPLALRSVREALQLDARRQEIPPSVLARIADLTPIQGLTSLQLLSLSGTQVRVDDAVLLALKQRGVLVRLDQTSVLANLTRNALRLVTGS